MQKLSHDRKKCVHFCALLLALILLCITPMLSSLYTYNQNHVEVEREGIQYASVKDTTVTQELYCDGHLGNLAVSFYAPSGELYGDAMVEISVSQGDKLVTERVRASKLHALSFYEKDPETQMEERSRYEMSYALRKNLWAFSQGTVTVSVSGVGLPAGTDLFCEVSSTLISGLPSAMVGVNVLGNPMVVEYDLFRTDAHFWYESALLCCLLLAIIGTAWLCTYRKQWVQQRNLLFWCAFVLIVLTISIRNPYASFWGEPRSEAVYEFWYKAEKLGLWGSLTSLMSGEALATLERIFMWVANAVSPRKYVFVVVQLMELGWIAAVCAMPCLNSFRRFFRDEIRLAVSLVLGAGLLFDSAYYFWSCSYWVILFLLLFAMLPLEKLRPVWYWGGIALTVILCLSRIYHILFVPIALIALFLLGKTRGKRFSIFCGAVAVASALEGIVSLVAETNLASGSSPFANIADIGLFTMIENTIYYQVQVINSFLTGAAHWQGSGANVLCGLCFLAILVTFFLQIAKKNKETALLMGSLGFLSLGTIAINVYTSGSFSAVSFPRNYASPIHWGETVYQEADLHFSYAYIALLILCLVLCYLLEIRFSKWVYGHIAEQERSAVTESVKRIGACALIAIFCVVVAVGVKPRLSYDKITVEWRECYQVTQRSPYFLSVNTFYGAAPISLEEGTDEKVFGLHADGQLYEWREGLSAYEQKMPYHSALVGSVSDISQYPVLSVTARRALVNFQVSYVAVLWDINGNELARVNQAQTDNRLWLDFLLDKPVTGVYEITFELQDGNAAFIQNGLQVGYVVE